MPTYLVLRRRRPGRFLARVILIGTPVLVGAVMAADYAALLNPNAPNPPTTRVVGLTLLFLIYLLPLIAWITLRRERGRRATNLDHARQPAAPAAVRDGDVRVLRITDIQQATGSTERVWATDTATGTVHDLWLPGPDYPLGAYVIVSINPAGEFTVHGWLPADIATR